MTSPTKDNTKVVLCCCDWPECETFHKIIQAKGPDGHPWRLPPIRIQFPERDPKLMFPTKSAFWQSVVRYLRSKQGSSQSPSEVFIYPHHFPFSFWDWNNNQKTKKNICTPFKKSEAHLLSKHDLSHDRYSKLCNSVFTFYNISLKNQQSTYIPPSDKFKYLYVKSPFVTRNEVSSYVHTLNNALNKKIKLQSSTLNTETYKNESTSSSSVAEPSSMPSPISSEVSLQHHRSIVHTKTDNTPQHPLIPTPSMIFPPVYKYYDAMRFIFHPLKGDVTAFCMNESVLMISKMIAKVYEVNTSFDLSLNNMSYVPCINGIGPTQNVTCNLYSIRRHNTGRVMLCSSCQKIQTSELRAINRQVSTPTRKRPYQTMSPEELFKSYSSSQKAKFIFKRRYNRLVVKLEDKTAKLMIEENSSAKECMLDVIKHLKTRWSYTKSDVTKLLMEVNLEGICKDKITITEKKECAEYICDTINNMSLHLNNNSGQCRYSPHIMNVCLALYGRSKAGYNELKESGLLPIPSASTLERLSKPFKIKEGFDPNVYLLLDIKNEIKKHGGSVKGHLMMDEIKLKNGILWNPKSNVVTGFVIEDLDTNAMLQEILGMGKSSCSGSKQLSVSANQWRFRSTKNMSHNSCYYYNTGSLNGNQIMGQFIDVVSTYELLGVQMLGLVSDGGGSNVGFFNTLFGRQDKYSTWPASDSVYSNISMKSNKRLMYWYCSVHGLKALRNNLFRSQPNMARDLKLHGRQFGWKEVRDIYLRDQIYYHKTGIWRTD